MRQGQSRHRVMMFGLMLDDTEWINNEPGHSWRTWLFIFSKISLNFTTMSWQPSAKRKLSSRSGPNQFQLALDSRCYRVFYFSLLHQIRLYQHPFQIHSVNTLFQYKDLWLDRVFHLGVCAFAGGDVATEEWSVFMQRGVTTEGPLADCMSRAWEARVARRGKMLVVNV